MAKSLLLLLFATTIMSASSPPPQQQQQLNNIIDALIGAEDFNSWANMLSPADLTAFPVRATFFIPSDSSEESSPAVDRMAMVMAYHIVPQRLSFSDLCHLNPLTRLPTFLPTKSILITNNSISNFTLDNSLLSHPHLYTSSTFVVHGIQTFLDYSVYGAADNHPFTTPPLPTPPLPPQQAQFTIWSELDAACLCLFWEHKIRTSGTKFGIEMGEYRLSLHFEGSNFGFWLHQWNKHGTQQGRLNLKGYFHRTKDEAVTVDLLGTLSIRGIKPSDSKAYPQEKYMAAIKRRTRVTGEPAVLLCNQRDDLNVLSEVAICINEAASAYTPCHVPQNYHGLCDHEKEIWFLPYPTK
ncbi:hypothetical protein Ddye_028867 [Dipteronia dyeriana]|uniref:FAS1 domain-containing protein n=1 Tax=Dipteronia dyeriana TaxID=168575 RepID=A0AAD9TE56_9ROSI|nr:hypothetical protein Ddye_028867 [Dipteronia dyeriana]